MPPSQSVPRVPCVPNRTRLTPVKKLKPFCIAFAVSAPLLLGACSSSDDDDDDHNPPVEQPGPGEPGEPGEPSPEPAPEPATLLEESFDAADGAAMPRGWSQATGDAGAISQRDGSLFVDGTSNNSAGTAVTLPASLAAQGNYRIDVTFTIAEANNTSRWVSIPYRISATSNMEPYVQMAIRQAATANNGTELAYREDGQWTVPFTSAFSEDIDPAKTYTATIVAYGNRVQQFLDGQLLHDAELDASRATGGVALQAAGAVMRVDHVIVKEQLTPLPSLGDIYEAPEPATGASLAPTLVGRYTSDPATAAAASNLMFDIDSGLNLLTASSESAGTLAQFLDQDSHAIPVLRLRDSATIEALAKLVEERQLVDITLVSDDADLLAEARAALPALRTALDLSASTLTPSRADLYSVVQQTNRSGSKIAILPPQLIERDAVAYLQRMLITAWAGAGDDSAMRAATVLASGVNGVVTPAVDRYAALLAQLPENTLLRKPLIVGHRGVPSRVDENTLEGAIDAYALGADAIESDIYLTTDGHIVVMHDTTVDRTTDGTGEIESMSLAEVQALTTTQGLKVPTLAQFFEEFKGEPVTQFVEIKTYNPAIIEPLKALIEEHGVEDQVIVISFSQDQLKLARQVMPEVSGGYLTSVPPGDDTTRNVRHILAGTQALSSTFNPSYGNLTPAIMEAAKHRGTTFWPWTFRDEAVAESYYAAGTHGLTTDYAQWFSDYPVTLQADASATAAIGAPVVLPATLVTQVGASQPAKATQFVVVESTAPHDTANGELTFSAPGTAVVMAAHTQDLGAGNTYTILSQPITLTIN